jgi:alpha-ribazole phosphatase/probable phosphoglycerate mutase
VNDRVRLWCLRHAESENVTTGTAGAVPTAPLTARGHHQAIKAASALAAEPITRICSSTALRARQTAKHLAALPGLDIKAMPELVEVGIGRHEGTSDPAIRAQTAQVLHAWIVEQDLGQRVADGETGHQVVARVTAALQKIVSTHPGETVAVVGHVASLTVTLGRLCALDHQVWGTPLPHARPFLIEWDGRTWHCPAWPSAVS